MSKKQGPKKVTRTILQWDLSHQRTETKYGYKLLDINRRICLKSVTIRLMGGVGEMFIDFSSIQEIDPNDHVRIQEDVRKLVDAGSFYFWQGSYYSCSRNGHHVTIHFCPQSGVDFCVTAIEKFVEIYKHFGCKGILALAGPAGNKKEIISRPPFPTITQETFVLTKHRLPNGDRILEPYNLHVTIPLYRAHFQELSSDLATYSSV